MAAKKGPVPTGPDLFAVIPLTATERQRRCLANAQPSIMPNPVIESHGPQVVPVAGSAARNAISLYESHQQQEFREYYHRTFGFDVSV